MAEPLGDQATDGSGFSAILRPEAEQILQPVEIEAAGRYEDMIALLADIAIRFVLIADLAKDFLDQIFHGGEARSIAVFIDYDHHMRTVALHVAEQITARLGFRD